MNFIYDGTGPRFFVKSDPGQIFGSLYPANGRYVFVSWVHIELSSENLKEIVAKLDSLNTNTNETIAESDS